MKKGFFILALMAACSASATDLDEVILKTYNNSDELKALQANLISEMERMPSTLSRIMPQASMSLTQQRQDRSESRYARSVSINHSISLGGLNRISTAQESFLLERAKYYGKEQQVIIGAIAAYFSVIASRDKLAATETSVNFAKKSLDAAETKLQVGDGTRTDVAQAKAELLSAEYENINAKQRLKKDLAALAATVNAEIDLDNLKKIDIPSEDIGTYEEFRAKILAKSYEIEEAKHSLMIAKLELKTAAADLLPTLDTRATWSNPGTSDLTASLSIPLYKGGAEYSTLRRAKSSARSSAHALANIKNKSQSSAVDTWESVHSSRAAFRAARQAVEYSLLLLDGVRQEYQLGSKSLLDVLSAERALYNNQIKEAEAYLNAMIAFYRAKAMCGELTAKALKIDTKQFDPDKIYGAYKFRVTP